MSEQRLLITGVGSELGSLAASLLERHPGFTDIVGLDVHPPRRRLRRTTYIRVEHNDPANFVRQILAHRPDVIVHLGVWEPLHLLCLVSVTGAIMYFTAADKIND